MTILEKMKFVRDLSNEIATELVGRTVCNEEFDRFARHKFEAYLEETKCELSIAESWVGLKKVPEDDIPDLVEYIGTPAMLEQTAEECAELAKAALKMARELRGENATHKNPDDILKNLHEEVADVSTCIYHLINHTDLCPEDDIKRMFNEKAERCRKRLAEVDEKREAKMMSNKEESKYDKMAILTSEDGNKVIIGTLENNNNLIEICTNGNKTVLDLETVNAIVNTFSGEDEDEDTDEDDYILSKWAEMERLEQEEETE